MHDTTWYHSLNSPALTPPDWIFVPVWFVLYVLMFVSLAFYIISNDANKKLGYIFFVIQFLLNLSWSPVFFGLKSILGGFIVIVLLDIFVYLTLRAFCKASKWACIFLTPYFLWILFATYLNSGYLFLNNF